MESTKENSTPYMIASGQSLPAVVEEMPLPCQAIRRALVVIPTYNEHETIDGLIRRLLEVSERVSVMIVDDNSPDGTWKLVEHLATEYPRVLLLRRAGKLGIGSAYLAGFRYGLAHDYDAVFTMDADCSHDPSSVPALLQAAEEADVVVGSRYCRGGVIRQWPWNRRMLSWGANLLARHGTGLRTKDCTSGFRCYRRQVLESLDLGQVKSQGYSCLVELLAASQRRGWRIRELPIVFVDRQFGKTKISSWEIARGAWTLLRLGIRRWR